MEQQKPFLEVVDTEKELLALIYAKKGNLDDEVLRLYRKIRTKYEDTLLKSDETSSVQYQEIEYHLWKLHYKLIDEFRKIITIRQGPINDTVSSEGASDPKTLERYNSFLSESANFYTNLIIKLRKKFGFPPVIFLEKDSHDGVIEKAKSDTCQHSCHRLLVCLGDLVRYGESCKNPGESDWSAAAKYYLEAAKIWPESGNPHNQLALLARHVDDPFLALYHLVRSLFVKDPFPDAWRNVLLLFDESRSAENSKSQKSQFDFLNPSISSTKPCNEDKCPGEELDLWPIFVRTVSFFFISSSFEDFDCTFSSTVHSLEALLESNDDANLFASLESYQRLDSSKKGPHHSLQIVSILIFLFHNITETSEAEKSEPNHNPAIKPLAISAIFVLMGRLVDRCHKKNGCPLLPAVLVFSEWLVEKIGALEAFAEDERIEKSLSYFLVALSALVQRMDHNKFMASDHNDNAAAVWEDHELRGFSPLAHFHRNLNFETDTGFSYGTNRARSHRLFLAASNVLERSRSYAKAIRDEDRLPNSFKKTLNLMTDQQQSAASEEEIIVFKPVITRRNSAPLEETMPTAVPDESLRRATSLYAEGQCQIITDEDSPSPSSSSYSFSFHHRHDKDTPGPPSLNAWVPPGQAGLKARDSKKEKLSPIDESPSPHTLPIPSAPLLPEELPWPTTVISPDYYRGGIAGNEPGDGILGAAPSAISAGSGMIDGGYASFLPPMSSSEWLYHYYRSGHQMNGRAFGSNEVLGFDSSYYDHWGGRFVPRPLIYPTAYVYGGGDHQFEGGGRSWEKGFLDYYGGELGRQQTPTPLLQQYLKERERQQKKNNNGTPQQF